MKDFSPKVSVVIPLFKAESYIEKCCLSLFNQSLGNIEFVFVDDASPDRSVEILKEIIEKFPNRKKHVKLLSNALNLGVAKTREIGVNNCTGDYIIHCDSDDWVDFRAYEIMLEFAIQKDADIVCCSYVVVGNGGKIYNYREIEENGQTMTLSLSPLYGALWNKLIKKSLYFDFSVRFFEGINMSEDLGLVTRLRYHSRRTVFVNVPLYFHTNYNAESIVNNFNKLKALEIIRCVDYLDAFFGSENVDISFRNKINQLKFESKLFFLISDEIRDYKLWKAIFPESNRQIWQYTTVPFNIRVIAFLVKFNFYKLSDLLIHWKRMF